ncbi:hypothetical protein EYF80_004523 [Liparis tanakae]|uniref:Uncharacterized protein n=1 Tax=Liparis tanakae TaxID=230148 RepID=A0A4Z2J6J6_9TELE|nr:hypothetical protein EYF80_004523 [Liparis tanakae]
MSWSSCCRDSSAKRWGAKLPHRRTKSIPDTEPRTVQGSQAKERYRDKMKALTRDERLQPPEWPDRTGADTKGGGVNL